MARNGTGTFSLLTNSWNPAVNGITATSADWQALINDVAAAITQSLSADGQTPMTGNLAMGNNRITGLAPASAATDALQFGQVTGLLDQWALISGTPTFVNATTFTLSGDQTASFQAGRRIKTQNTAGVVYGTIVGSSFSTPTTTVTVGNDSGSLDSGLSAVFLGVITPNNTSLPVPFQGMRNRLINGNFSVNQRAVSGSVVLAAGSYGHDRWKAGASGCTYTFATANGLTTITITAGSLVQVIEGASVEGGNYKMSWQGTAQGRVLAGTYGVSPVGIAGAAGGANLSIEFGLGTLTRAQVEPGLSATPFEQRPYGLELSLCQRYYQPFSYFGGTTSRANLLDFTVPTGVQMRATPTATNFASGGGSASAAIYNGTAWFQAPVAANNATATGLVGPSVLLSYAYSGATAGWPGSIAIAGTLSAEL